MQNILVLLHYLKFNEISIHYWFFLQDTYCTRAHKRFSYSTVSEVLSIRDASNNDFGWIWETTRHLENCVLLCSLSLYLTLFAALLQTTCICYWVTGIHSNTKYPIFTLEVNSLLNQYIAKLNEINFKCYFYSMIHKGSCIV